MCARGCGASISTRCFSASSVIALANAVAIEGYGKPNFHDRDESMWLCDPGFTNDSFLRALYGSASFRRNTLWSRRSAWIFLHRYKFGRYRDRTQENGLPQGAKTWTLLSEYRFREKLGIISLVKCSSCDQSIDASFSASRSCFSGYSAIDLQSIAVSIFLTRLCE